MPGTAARHMRRPPPPPPGKERDVLMMPLLKLLEEYAPHAVADVNARVRRIVEICDGPYFDRHLGDTNAQAYLAASMLHTGIFTQLQPVSPHIHADPSAPMRALLDTLAAILATTTSSRTLLIVYEILLHLGDINWNCYRWLLLVHNIWAGHYATQNQARIGSDTGSVAPPLPLPSRQTSWSTPVDAPAPSYISVRTLEIWLQRRAAAVMYEMFCAVRLRAADLRSVNDVFVNHLFDQVEATRAHADETFGALVTDLLLAMNEQHMVAIQGPSFEIWPYSVLGMIQSRLHATRTFAENLVFMLNRTPSTTREGSQFHFLVLKLLDGLFAMEQTASYFYMNDLKVLVDIFLREIADLPDTSELLRQVYLRVLHALLTQTQLCTVPYKRKQVTHVLQALIELAHLRPIDPNTYALTQRCLQAEWCVDGGNVHESTTMVASIGGGKPHAASDMIPERTSDGVMYHAQTSDAAISHLLVLGRMQSAAAGAATMRDVPSALADVLWPDALPEPLQQTSLDLDVAYLELATTREASRPADAEAEPRRRKAPQPPQTVSTQIERPARSIRASPVRTAQNLATFAPPTHDTSPPMNRDAQMRPSQRPNSMFGRIRNTHTYGKGLRARWQASRADANNTVPASASSRRPAPPPP
ncbi:pre-rRNA processing [Malassezia vespertilionis]|uniref:pre-rRNA processing n=1 Tax=Malassezia vespertilionis TaxID=2020962 RepID=UPI0024B23019|nr:pre-rRNA processing [Malassezia vespertilionis]WFD04788.1 pre-rRNA processing [Malassezia vespertilionis]